MYANGSKFLGAVVVSMVALVMFSVLFVLQFGIPLSFAANQIAPNVILSVTVNSVCEISLNTQAVSFGNVIASQNTLTTSQNVLDTNNGNGGTFIWVDGGNWIGPNGIAPSFGVTNTVYSASSANSFGASVALTQIPANSNIFIGIATSNSVWFGLGIPAGQAANVYTQNIIITNVC